MSQNRLNELNVNQTPVFEGGVIVKRFKVEEFDDVENVVVVREYYLEASLGGDRESLDYVYIMKKSYYPISTYEEFIRIEFDFDFDVIFRTKDNRIIVYFKEIPWFLTRKEVERIESVEDLRKYLDNIIYTLRILIKGILTI